MRTMTPQQRLAAAYQLSQVWFNGWFDHKNDQSTVWRRFALKCKTKSLIIHDRVLTNRKVDTSFL